MPHIKAKPFAIAQLDALIQASDRYLFRATSLKQPDTAHLIGVKDEFGEFLLLLQAHEDLFMIKSEKVTRPIDAERIKRAIKALQDALGLEVYFSNIILHHKKPSASCEFEKSIDFFEQSVDFGFEKVAVEVGFGSGRHILYRAKQNPDTLFIGLEIHTPSAKQLLKQIGLQKIQNIRVVGYDARLFLQMLPSNLLERIYVHFPVPWDKKPHRRVIGDLFIKESIRTLKKGGVLELRTDSSNYYTYALERFMALPRVNLQIFKNRSLEVMSKYEARWRNMGKDIYDLLLSCDENSPPKKEVPRFNFDNVRYVDKMQDRIPYGSRQFDGFFVNFENSYPIKDEALLLKVSFGSFDRPEHKYILIDRSCARFFGSPPVRIEENKKAFDKIVIQLKEAMK